MKHNKRKNCRSNSSAFTLTELMVTVAIIGVITAAAFPKYLQQIQKARQSDTTNQISQIMTTIQAYREEFLEDPSGWNDLARITPVKQEQGVAKRWRLLNNLKPKWGPLLHSSSKRIEIQSICNHGSSKTKKTNWLGNQGMHQHRNRSSRGQKAKSRKCQCQTRSVHKGKERHNCATTVEKRWTCATNRTAVRTAGLLRLIQPDGQTHYGQKNSSDREL